MSANGQGPRAYATNRERDLAVYDSLPEVVKRAMQGASFNYPSADFAAILATNPPERVAAYVPAMDAKLIAREGVRADPAQKRRS